MMTHLFTTLTWISAVMAAFSADSKPPSAIKLLTNRSIMKRRPGLMLISFPDAGREKKVLSVSTLNNLGFIAPIMEY